MPHQAILHSAATCAATRRAGLGDAMFFCEPRCSRSAKLNASIAFVIAKYATAYGLLDHLLTNLIGGGRGNFKYFAKAFAS